MKLPEHVAFSALLAQLGAQQDYGPTGTALVIAAGLLPDLDGLTILGGWRCHRTYHRVIGHGLPVTLGGPLALTLFGAWLLGPVALGPLWCWLQLSVLAHLVSDFLFYRWPVQLLWPFSSRGVGFGWIGWNDLIPTLILYGGVALAIVWPGYLVAAASLGLLALYVGWRGFRSPAPWGWAGWLTGAWAPRGPRLCRWLTGDFVT
ncbi:MAG TPA: metal-dependent hydrolase [Gemmataceae bacterium]|nr:metal-dependent hydrolase [Gemmataceae bacterium]